MRKASGAVVGGRFTRDRLNYAPPNTEQDFPTDIAIGVDLDLFGEFAWNSRQHLHFNESGLAWFDRQWEISRL